MDDNNSDSQIYDVSDASHMIRGKKKGGKKKKWEGKISHGGDEPPCILCQTFKVNANPHSTNKCNKRKDFLAFLKEGPPRKKPFKQSTPFKPSKTFQP